uniref:uncharacterized protein LOC101294957 n=1 Tax=Fragaria vesca subsp. vesca TaxID=101020 RepID=UPI0005C9977A|nr:PREDICTED: uncharacterized protein LOC101294957 [Fragaria vesca subsp. vesca]
MALTALKGPATAAVLLCFLLTYHLNPALAATAGSDDNSDSDSDSYRFSTDFVSYPRRGPPEERKGQQWIFGWLIMGAFAVLVFKCSTYGRSTVIKLQVGESGTARTLQKDLDQMPKIEYACFPQKDLSCVLTGATAALLRHSHDCISGYSSVATIRNIYSAYSKILQSN